MNMIGLATLATLLEVDPRVVRDAQPVAAALACAIDDRSPEDVARTLAPLDKVDLHALVVLLASMVDVDVPFQPGRLSPERTCRLIAQRAAHHFGVDVDVLYGTGRTPTVTHARMVAMVAARRAGFVTTEIGAHFGRDHTTVSYASERVARDPGLSSAVARICRELRLDDPEAA